MAKPLAPHATIGIIGGGQLGRMTAMAAARLGYRSHIYAPEPDSPAFQIAAAHSIADYEDETALARFAEQVDVITFEFENISAESLAVLASRRPVRPGPEVLRISQDRLLEKQFLNSASIQTAPWRAVTSLDDLTRAIAELGLPAVLKTTRLGYDGKGQRLLRSPDDAVMALAQLNPKPLILEGFVDFAAEGSVLVARSPEGRTSVFDMVENRHRNHILDLTLAPAPFASEIRQAAQTMALRIAERIDLVGLLAVEFFIDPNGRVIANEIAPRPHNSGHWTIDACPVSQFEMQVRAIAGLPLPPARRHADAVMKNLIGPDDMALWPTILATDGLIPHHYGKRENRPGRKLGHVTVLFPRNALPGEFGIAAALGPLGNRTKNLEQ
jgi:5-(carboxyamino)imidazole ribonucleotide synthase